MYGVENNQIKRITSKAGSTIENFAVNKSTSSTQNYNWYLISALLVLSLVGGYFLYKNMTK